MGSTSDKGAAIMDEDRFWSIIAQSRARVDPGEVSDSDEFCEAQSENLKEILAELSPEEIIAYDARFSDLSQKAYRWDLWGAAYWPHGGCSDDGFIDFRSCLISLISLGKELYYQILNDPDSLADVDGRPDVPYMQSEGFQYLAREVYEEKTGERHAVR
ncbi:MAG TPA: DUF4240 domain-containing protein [Isosphaeraceae bacterium]|jgi:hypothetical protein|nr:DUF4240 domain-containing protein [Isosphaeraceae bacterium]